MDHVNITVVGYGVVLNIVEFVKVFPESFKLAEQNSLLVYPNVLPQYRGDNDRLKKLEDCFKVSFHFDQHSPTIYMFITSKDSPKEYVQEGGYQQLDLEKLRADLPALQSFIHTYFPEKEIKLMMFSYESSY